MSVTKRGGVWRKSDYTLGKFSLRAAEQSKRKLWPFSHISTFQATFKSKHARPYDASKQDGLITVFGSWPFHSRVDRESRTWLGPWSLLHYPSVTNHISRHLRSNLLGPPLNRPLAWNERQWTPKHAVHLPDGVIYWFSMGSGPQEPPHPYTRVPHSAE